MKRRGGYSDPGRAERAFADLTGAPALPAIVAERRKTPARPPSILPVLIRHWLTLDDTTWLRRLEREGNVTLLCRLGAAWPKGVALPDEIARVAA